MARRIRFAILGSLLLFASTGCYSRKDVDGTIVYGFAWWVQTGVVLAAVVAFPAGWFLYKKWEKAGFILMGMAPILGVFAVPAMFLDKIELAPTGFKAQWGIWFAPRSADIQFASLESITLQVTEREGRGGTTEDFSALCRLKNGESETVPLGDLMRRAIREIINAAKARGVTIQGDALLERIEARLI